MRLICSYKNKYTMKQLVFLVIAFLFIGSNAVNAQVDTQVDIDYIEIASDGFCLYGQFTL